MKNEADRADSSADADPLPKATDRLLQRFHDAELRPSERKEFEARLQNDPGLQAELARLERASAFFAADAESCEPAPLPVGFVDRLFSRIKSEQATPVQPKLKRWIAIAASFLIFLLAAHAFTLPPQGDDLSANERQDRASLELLELLDRKKDALLLVPTKESAGKGEGQERKK